MRLWQDSDEEVEVRWFRAAPGAKILPGPHPFGSWWAWDRKDGVSPPGVGEQRYVRYDRGDNPLGYLGHHHCGGVEAVREGGVHGRDPLLQTDADGWAACCGPRPRVAVCGNAYPKQLIARFYPTGDCACGAGVEIPIRYRAEELTVFGVTAQHWWLPEDAELPGLDFSPWDYSWPHFRLGSCEGNGFLHYIYPWFAITEGTCVRSTSLHTYMHFNLLGTDEKRIASSHLKSDSVIQPGPPWRLVDTCDQGVVAGPCNFSELPRAELHYDEA